MISGIIPVSSVFNPFCYACASVTASLSGVFRMNRLQMLLRIQAETWGLGLCVFMWKRERERERVNDWHQTRVLHSGGSVGATQPVWQVIISVSCSGMTATSSETKHTTHTNSFPWVTEECLSKPIDWAINWGPTGNPLQSICPLLHGSRNATMAVALN